MRFYVPYPRSREVSGAVDKVRRREGGCERRKRGRRGEKWRGGRG
jgi:hypothetical protein